ncbi:MAG TPA: glycosyltransferase family 4 protein [Acidimicrobiales bacterium]|nr:glycosyltransferase family 4 protein [Acidimicrobiales bacterium]
MTAGTHLLVTNDFPPKVGGIQVYLWELWRRLDPSSYAVYSASSHPDAAAFDAEQATRGVRIRRDRAGLLFPTPQLVRAVRRYAEEVGASLLVVDPALPLGLAAPAFGIPYAVVLHGAEVTVPGRLPGTKQLLAHVLRHARLAICAGGYPAAEGRRAAGRHMPPVVQVPPGVDTARFAPLHDEERAAARRRLGVAPDDLLVVSVSRLVPRKGMDVLVDATATLAPSFPHLQVLIGGDGRDRVRLAAKVADTAAPVRLVGRISDEDLPSVYGAADLFVMACRDRWLGLEQEGFGIVFLEAAAAGVPQIAGRSGGADEAVEHGVTGLVVDDPGDAAAVADAMRTLLTDAGLRRSMAEAGRRRAVGSFGYDQLARRLAAALADVTG